MSSTTTKKERSARKPRQEQCFLSHRNDQDPFNDTSSDHSFTSFSSGRRDDSFKLIGSGRIGAGFISVISVGAYSTEIPVYGEEQQPASAGRVFDHHLHSHPTIISLKLQRDIGIWAMVTYLDHGLRKHVRRVRKEQKRTKDLPYSAEDSLYDDYMIRQCQQLVASGLGSSTDKNTAAKGTVVDIFSDAAVGRVAVSVNGNKPKVLYDCPELAAASINMFTGKRSFDQSLRRNCVKRCKQQMFDLSQG